MKKRESTESAVTVRGLIETMYFSKDGFAAGLLRLADDSTVKFAGPIYARENDPVVLCGRWHNHPKYGRQFKVTGVSLDLEIDAAGLARYLANHPEFKGIGPAKAALIAEEFAGNFNETITHNPEAIARAAKLSLDAVYAVREAWLENRNRNAAATHLAAYGLTHKQITALVEQFGDSVVPMLEENPYLLVSAVPGMGFKRIDKAARKMNTPKESPGRIRAGLLYCINEALEEGDCWVEYEDLLDRANLLLVMDDLDSREMIERHLEALVREGELVTSPYECLVVAKPEIEEMERDLAEAFRRAAEPNPHYSDFDNLESLARKHEPRLNAQQCEAVAAALRHRISLLSGGAGTGKTFTIRTLVEICREKGLRVEMAATTGKAAKRMEQLVKQPAQTIHRLLQFDGHEFKVGPGNPIQAGMVIVDEVSMLDVRLAWRLFRAINFDRTALLLVGDHNQLPPVGPGNVLRDLIQSLAIPTVILPKVMRQAGELKENCAAVLDGEVRPTSDCEERGRRPWYVVDQFSDSMEVRRFLLMLFEKVLAERLRFDIVKDVQVLSPTHKGPIGTRSLNIDLQQLIQWKLHGARTPELDENSPFAFLLHDKVIQTRNNYKTGIMNGTIGVVADVLSDGGIVVDFEGALVGVGRDSPERQDLQLAYCLSIHKCQGSEFPCAIVITHKSHEYQHHRNLLYTGVTRAQHSAIILGDHWGIHHCAHKRQVDRRNTFLSFLLSEPRAASG
ncbi:MAG TPA: AAA family ATPase [Bryobacteraceae bacterium]|jgi:exodeoxyribonuclease V alpha subunit|nr:AAA family ATPase [Bryobacteraceae bacterium]